MSTLPPTITGVDPETWEILLQVAAQLGTNALVLVQQGITTVEQLNLYLAQQGYHFEEIMDLVPTGKFIIVANEAVDPSTTNAVANRVITDITVVGGVASQAISRGDMVMSLVKKVIAAGVAVSLLVSTLDAQFITDVLKDDLDRVIQRFTIDGENVPVIITKEGKTYYMQEMIDAVRELLIEKGVYNGLTPSPIDNNINILYKNTNDADFSNVMVYASGYNGMLDGYTLVDTLPFGIEHTPDGDKMKYLHKTLICYNGRTGTRFDLEFDDFLVNKYTNPNTNETTIYGCWIIEASKIPYYGGGDYLYAGGALLYYEDGSDAPFVGFSNQAIKIFRDPVTHKEYGVVQMPIISASTLGPDPSYYSNLNGQTTYDPLSLTQDSRKATFFYTYVNTGGESVDGITVSADLLSRGIANAQTALDDIYGVYQTDYLETASPTDEDLENKLKWFPVDTHSVDIWVTGISEDESADNATDGQVDPSVHPDIMDGVQDMTEDILRDPNNPDVINYPEIPVQDSGDTPPAEPPLIDAAGNGLWAIYNPTKAQVNSFGQWLWSSNIVDQITRMFNSPIDAVIGFHMIYCTPVNGTPQNIMCGYLDSGISSDTVANQYVTIDCGSVVVPEYYRTALDYVATKLSLYLPFIGFVPLSTAVCMGSTLNIVYRIDVLTGTCLAQVKVIKENSDAVMYTFPGNCSVQVPLTATTYTGMVSTLVGVANTAIGVAMDSPGSVIAGAKQALEGAVESVGTGGVKQSGAIGANAGVLGIRIPYLVITHPVAYDAFEYSKQYGFPLNETVRLSQLRGYTKVKDIHLQDIPCTDDELEMIERLLKDGVIIN